MLNPAQRDAVQTPGHCMITACPGSGKTTVLVHRAAFLLRGHPGSTLVGVTFTADAANELKLRIAKMMPEAADRVLCGTFHSLCKRQLEAGGQRVRIIDESEQDQLIRRACLRVAGVEGVSNSDRYPFDQAKAFISNIKCQVDPIMPSPHLEPMVEVYEAYQKMLGQMGVKDFSDLLVDAVRGMSSGRVAPLKCNFMLVDEAQDTDEVQLAWLLGHVAQGVQATVVGDDDQSIYSWRAALGLEALERFKKATNATHVALNVTYRCAREIVTPAARLITQNNGNRVEKQLDTVFRGRGSVRLRSFAKFSDEAEAISTEIHRSGLPHEWAVLARGNAQLDIVDTTLGAEHVPYTRSGGKSMWEMAAPSLLLGVARSLARGDLLGVDSLLRAQGASDEALERFHQRYDSARPGALRRFMDDDGMKGSSGIFRYTWDRINGWDEMLRANRDNEVLEKIAYVITRRCEVLGRKTSEEERQMTERILGQCVASLCRFRGSLGRRIDDMQRHQANKEKPPTTEEERISRGASLMTMHASKGLEFQNVWIIGCRAGTTPSSKSISLAEERRLFYVAMTRAKTNLILSYVSDESYPPSMFLHEAGII